jgi:outer membrane protein assembly factor BamB
MFESNRRSYTAFRTLTGEIIRKGTLDIELRNPRRVIGRNLFYMVTTIAGKRMRVWDSVYDRIIFDEPARSTYLATTVLDAENELAVVLPGNRLRIFNAETGKILLNVLLSEKQLQNLSYIRVSRDAQRYFVNFQYQPRFIWMARSSLYADTFLPRLDVQGDLYVFNKNTGQQLWKRTLPQRSILRLPEYDLPFLITISRERGRQKNNTQSLLVEAIDIQTGETLGSAVNLFPDRLVQMSVDRDRGVVLLHGLKNEIRLDFGPQKQRFNFQDETL